MWEPGGLPSMGLHRVGHDWSDLAAAGGKLLYNVMLVSAIQRHKLAIIIHISPPSWLFIYRLITGSSVFILVPHNLSFILWHETFQSFLQWATYRIKFNSASSPPTFLHGTSWPDIISCKVFSFFLDGASAVFYLLKFCHFHWTRFKQSST